MSLCILSDNELHRQTYKEFHTHKQASGSKIVTTLHAIEINFINEETTTGKGGGSRVVAKFPKECRFKCLRLEDEMHNLTAVCRDFRDTQHAFKVCL